jgi:Rrf2 family protein
MKITQEGDYALRVVLFLYKYGQGRRVEAKVISAHENIPPRFLLKLLRKLTVGNIVKSYMGYGGGYAVEKPPQEITVRGVIEAIEGPICINKCLGDADLCNLGRANTCEIHAALESVQQNLVAGLDELTFAKLLNNSKNG